MLWRECGLLGDVWSDVGEDLRPPSPLCPVAALAAGVWGLPSTTLLWQIIVAKQSGACYVEAVRGSTRTSDATWWTIFQLHSTTLARERKIWMTMVIRSDTGAWASWIDHFEVHGPLRIPFPQGRFLHANVHIIQR